MILVKPQNLCLAVFLPQHRWWQIFFIHIEQNKKQGTVHNLAIPAHRLKKFANYTFLTQYVSTDNSFIFYRGLNQVLKFEFSLAYFAHFANKINKMRQQITSSICKI